MSTIKDGKSAEHLVISKLLKLGYDVFTPVSDDFKIDIIYNKENILYKVQIKLIGFGNYMPVRKIKVNSKTNTKIYHYTKEDVDEFIAVDLKTQEIYIIPIEFVNLFTSSISLKTIKANFQVI